MKIYLIARKLSHSFSPEIHRRLSDYSYELNEIEPEELESFFKKREFDGLNVTIPYKKEVIKYLDFISPEAEKMGAVNTVVNKEGKLYGYNTDIFGFIYTVKRSGVRIKGKKVVIVGNGGASQAVSVACEKLGALSVRIITRAENTAENIKKYLDGEIVINATPVGMYPDNMKTPLNIEEFKRCSAVFDLIYNPQKTKLILDSEKLGKKAFNGMAMLVAQAKAACELFTGREIPGNIIENILNELTLKTENIVLVGMPGAGKTTVGRIVAEKLGREFFDCDEKIQKLGKSPAEIIKEEGEAKFRKIETEALAGLCKKSGVVIASGGGAVTVEENHDIIHQNAFTVFIDRETALLETTGRPLSEKEGVGELFKKRLPMYEKICDVKIKSRENAQETAEAVLRAFERKNMKILVINGPNLNMLGIREPDIYGKKTYEDLVKYISEKSAEMGIYTECWQSNHEGEIVEKIQAAYGFFDGIVINPAAYTHTSVAILDALKSVGIPTVEVHISDVYGREDFRKHSYVSLVAEKTIAGKGFDGYIEAISFLADLQASRE